MEELLALLERYSPGYRNLIQGFHEWYVDDLEETFGRTLPGFYKEFVRTVGQQAGPLLAHVHEYEPFHVASLYRSTAMDMPPRRFFLLLGDPDPLAPMPYWLDLDAPSGDGDCEVVRIAFSEDAWKERIRREFVSFREMLFTSAMENVCLPTLPHQVRYYRDERQDSEAENIARILEKMGFKRLPLLHHSFLFEREGAAISLYRPPDKSHVQLCAGMRSADEFKLFQMLMEDHTSMKRP